MSFSLMKLRECIHSQRLDVWTGGVSFILGCSFVDVAAIESQLDLGGCSSSVFPIC